MQQILHGIEHLPAVLSDSHKVLLVCDASYPYLSIRPAIDAFPHTLVRFDKFTSNPLYEDVCQGVQLFRHEQCDTILAVGGGSAIDVAKCIKLYCRMDDTQSYLQQPYTDSGVPLVAIPTTAGTGSESTRYAVIYAQGVKQSVTHESIIPDVAILEPKVLSTLPLYQKKCTLLDALCQGMESWWSVNSTEESQKYSRTAVETIMAHWRDYIFDNDSHAATQVMEAANYAGRAICITQTTAPHAFSYKLTSLYGIPHGHAVAIGLSPIWQYMLSHPDKCIDPRGATYLSGIFRQIASAMGCSTSEEAIARFRQMLTQMEMALQVNAHNDTELDILATSVNPIRLGNNPISLNGEAIREIYREIVNRVPKENQ